MFQQYSLPAMDARPGHKRKPSRSPSPPSKRRAPPSCSPALCAPIPTASAFHPQLHRNLSLETSYSGGTPASERSSPGADWLQRTENLQLSTPLARGGSGQGIADDDAMQDGTQVGQPSDDMANKPIDDDPHALAYAPLPAMPRSTSVGSPYHFLTDSGPASAAPHDAPSLYHHLAGSPSTSTSMTRSTSTDSTHSMTSFAHPLSPPHLTPFPEPHTISYDGPTTMASRTSEIAMDLQGEEPDPTASSLHNAAGLNGGGAGQKGGWKITMGYRSDCEKCQQRIPGHYTHVVYNS
ncbi:hypothetical protein JCM10212_005038 [Sporobolomyces blumeae]